MKTALIISCVINVVLLYILFAPRPLPPGYNHRQDSLIDVNTRLYAQKALLQYQADSVGTANAILIQKVVTQTINLTKIKAKYERLNDLIFSMPADSSVGLLSKRISEINNH